MFSPQLSLPGIAGTLRTLMGGARYADRSAFVGAMAATVSGVTVVTTDGAGGRHGLTVSAMTSVSADPPLLLVAINRRNPLVAAIRANGGFGVSVLGAHQASVADSFAGRPGAVAPYDFGHVRWEQHAGGAPLLAGSAARFDCALASMTDAASHVLVLGAVRHAARDCVPALAYTRREYAFTRPLSRLA